MSKVNKVQVYNHSKARYVGRANRVATTKARERDELEQVGKLTVRFCPNESGFGSYENFMERKI